MRLLPRLLLHIVAPFLAVAIILLLLLGNAIENRLHATIVEAIDLNLGLRAQAIGQQIDADRRTLRLLADAEIAHNAHLREIRGVLTHWHNHLPEAENLLFFSLDGQAWGAGDNSIDVRDRDYFQQILRGERVTSSVIASRITGNQVILIAEPVFDAAGKNIGALGATINVTRLADWVRRSKLATGGVALLVERNGLPLVAHPDESAVVGAPVDLAGMPQTAAILGTPGAEGKSAWIVRQQGITGTPWTLVIAHPREQVLVLIDRAWRLGALLIGLFTLASALAVWLFNRSLLQPIRQLAEAQQALLAGRRTRIDNRRGDELGELSQSFDHMAAQLDKALRDARDSEARFRNLFENAGDALVIVDGNRIVDCNSRACELYECSREEMLSVPASSFSPPEQPDGSNSFASARQLLADALAGRPQFAFWRHVSRKGRCFDAEVSMKRIDLDGQSLVYCIVRDVSAREQNARKMAAVEAKFRRIFAASIDSIIVARLADGLVIEANEGFERLTGHPLTSAIGKTTFELELWEDPAQRQQLLTLLNDSGQARNFPMALRRKDGSRRELDVSAACFDLDGELHYVAISRDVTEDIALRMALQASEARLTTIIETTPSPICINRLTDLAYVRVNPAWEATYGVSSVQALGRTLAGCGLVAVNPGLLAKQTGRLRAEGRIDGQEAEFITPDGRRVTIIYSSRIIELDGEAVMISINTDISRLIETSRRLQAIVEGAPAIIVINRIADFSYVEVNPEFERLFGVRAEEVIGRTMEGAGFTIVSRQNLREQTARLLADGHIDNAQAEVLTPAGRPVTFVYSSRVTELDGEPVMLSMAADITHLKEVEAGLRQAKLALQESEQRFIALFQSSPIALSVALQGADGYVFSELNTAWHRHFGWSSGEALGKKPTELGLWPDSRDYATMIRRIEEEGEINDCETRLRRQDKTVRLCRISGRRLVVGAHTLWLAAYVDITDKARIEEEIRELNNNLEIRMQQRTHELQQAQADLMRSEKLAALGALVAGVAHELNTPIGTSLTVASTLAEKTRAIEISLQGGLRRSELVQFIGDSGSGTTILTRNLQRAAELIQSFKSIAVDQASDQRRDFDLRQIVDETLIALRPSLKRNPCVVVNEVESGLHMNSYAGSLEQVIVNLVNNAIVHGFDGERAGTVTVSGAAAGTDRIRLVVSDNGCGIPKANLPRIFDPFFTTRLGRGGSGLGLHIVRNIVTDVLGGNIVAHSESGKGTEMCIELPRRAPDRLSRADDREALQP